MLGEETRATRLACLAIAAGEVFPPGCFNSTCHFGHAFSPQDELSPLYTFAGVASLGEVTPLAASPRADGAALFGGIA